MPYLILGVGLLLGLYFLGRWFVVASPQDVRRVLTRGGIGIVLLISGFMLFTGRAGIAGLVLLALVPSVLQLRARARAAKAGANGTGRGRTSTVRTRFLDMALNHATGALDGLVVAGGFEGRHLSELSLDELLALLAEVAEDEQSERIMQAYLDREHPDWHGRAEARGRPGSGNGRMTADEAREILGVGPQATADEIETAYRAAMKRNHPDAGGSSWLAAKINEARSLLLG
jgi:hypothetical protein